MVNNVSISYRGNRNNITPTSEGFITADIEILVIINSERQFNK